MVFGFGYQTLPAWCRWLTALALATLPPSGSIGIRPGTVDRRVSITAVPLALSSMSLAPTRQLLPPTRQSTLRASMRLVASTVSVNDKRSHNSQTK